MAFLVGSVSAAPVHGVKLRTWRARDQYFQILLFKITLELVRRLDFPSPSCKLLCQLTEST